MTDKEILERLGLTMPEPPKHFTDKQKSGEEQLPAMTRVGVGVGSFMAGCSHLVASLTPQPLVRAGQNFGYGYRLGGVMHTVNRAQKQAQAVMAQNKVEKVEVQEWDNEPRLEPEGTAKDLERSIRGAAPNPA